MTKEKMREMAEDILKYGRFYVIEQLQILNKLWCSMGYDKSED